MRSIVSAVFLAGLMLVSAIVVYGKSSSSQPDMRFFTPKAAEPLTAGAVDFLQQRQTDGKADVWVFFTDKGFTDGDSFQRAKLAHNQLLTERALARRAKHGINEIRLRDLPVSDRYVSHLASFGAEIRRNSKWLNAAAVTVDIDKLEMIAGQPFVQRIEPIARYHRVEPELSKAEVVPPPVDRSALEAHSLAYGASFTQLDQINVPICHDSGYTGAGMLIAVFDTGFRTSHSAFANIVSEGRLIAQYDFIFDDAVVDNEAEDVSSAWSHGTSTWSDIGGERPGTLYGAAFDAEFIVCKTEDVRSETQVEEDNWVAALEFVDSIGADIVSSSLSYSDWYTSSDYDGNTCVTTVAADMAAENGILICNSAGNAGPTSPSLGAPADADSIITVGAVTSSGTLASFSSRGPTFDGRIKPEVCAMGVSATVASSAGDLSYSSSSGTSFSCPITAGAAAVVWAANPGWTNMQVREALMQTASNAATPDNNYGWGIIDTWAALNYYFAPAYIPGDADGNGSVSVGDAVYLVNYIFGGGPEPWPVLEVGDFDCSGAITIGDVVYLINYIFGGGPAPQDCNA